MTEQVFPTFPYADTVISQYANSPALTEIVTNLATVLDAARQFNDFHEKIWNLDTAEGYGLDVWGRIVGVGRVLLVPDETKYFGFVESVDGFPFEEGIFYNGGTITANYALSDAAYRRLIYAKAKSNIWDGSLFGINQILIRLFSSYGNCFARSSAPMELTYFFETRLSPVDYAIVAQSGVLPRPAGVAAFVSMP